MNEQTFWQWAQRRGVLAIITCYLVWQFSGGIRADVSEMRKEHSRMEYYLRGICLNTAASDSQRANCAYPVGQ